MAALKQANFEMKLKIYHLEQRISRNRTGNATVDDLQVSTAR